MTTQGEIHHLQIRTFHLSHLIHFLSPYLPHTEVEALSLLVISNPYRPLLESIASSIFLHFNQSYLSKDITKQQPQHT